MTLSYKARRRWALVILLIAMPLYIVVSVRLITLLDRPSVFLELAIYAILGVAWIFPFKFIFRGIGQADRDQDSEKLE